MWHPDPSIIVTAEMKAAQASEAAWAALRVERDRRLAAHDWRVTRHYEETLAGAAMPSLTPEAFDALFNYRKALRDLPANTVDPADPVWPSSPLST